MSRLGGLLLLALLLGTWARPLQHPAVINLNAASFDLELRNLPADSVALIEFFASWCPACRRFAPEYDKVGAFFKRNSAKQPGVFVARVDCAEQVALCGEFKMSAFPTIFLGSAASFITHSADNVTTYPHDKKRMPAEIVAWVAQQLSAEYVYDEPAMLQLPSQAALKWAASPSLYQFALADVERATVEMLSQATLGLQGATKRAALLTLVKMFRDAHPSPRCEQGSVKLVSTFQELWPEGREQPEEALLHFPICGDDVKELQWVACNDNGTNTRGFTCAVWLLLHSMAARYPAGEAGEAEAGRHIMAMLNAYARNFFKCGLCAQHFMAMLDARDASAVVSKRDAVLWLWRSHNKVNARLAEEEASAASGKPPGLPKVQWPPVELCASCRLPSLPETQNITWAEDEVYAFLLRFFGSTAAGAASHLSLDVGVRGHRARQDGATTVGQFTRSTLLFLALLLAVWYMAAIALKKHRPAYRRHNSWV